MKSDKQVQVGPFALGREVGGVSGSKGRTRMGRAGRGEAGWVRAGGLHLKNFVSEYWSAKEHDVFVSLKMKPF